MVDISSIIDLARVANQSANSSGREQGPRVFNWELPIENPNEEPIEVSSITIGQKFDLPEGVVLNPGDLLALHQGEGADGKREYYWPNGPDIRPDDMVYVRDEAGELKAVLDPVFEPR